MKKMLEEKKESLTKSLEQLTAQQAQIAEQIVMHRGALQYNEMLLKELAEPAVKVELSQVPDAEETK